MIAIIKSNGLNLERVGALTVGGGGILLSGKKARGGFAGLALHEDSLRYLELERNGADLRVARQEFIPVPAGGVVKESLQKVGLMESLRDNYLLCK